PPPPSRPGGRPRGEGEGRGPTSVAPPARPPPRASEGSPGSPAPPRSPCDPRHSSLPAEEDSPEPPLAWPNGRWAPAQESAAAAARAKRPFPPASRSEERRVGIEGLPSWADGHQ